ncbi:helicase [Alkalihalobacillus sp. LMS39]|uniref:helicase n=1 Tax=Alkalihalobacillus sp. LMS39 TaxID=2924032 RepID=UPI001FB3295C|nr:helicase [Alkalihalobacillus sp. LMS39]UOE95237.1 helicase [Alkalihalobacillus sp. LMS39]
MEIEKPMITRTIEVGGLTKQQLRQRLQEFSVLVNEYGERLLADENFITSEKKYKVETVELTVRSLGFPDGATMPDIYKQADELGLKLCPLELGPYLRLHLLDQTEGNLGISLQNQAPTGSITVASKVLYEDDDFPKGFYLRRIDGQLWLRGYIADDLHMWNANDCFVFCLT